MAIAIGKHRKFNWRTFLRSFSKDLLEDSDIRDACPRQVVESGWLGHDGATEEQIATLERRLHVPLPPSYRSFLAASNGWRQCGYFVECLYSTDEVAWFRELHQAWIDSWLQAAREQGEPPEVPDEEYFFYGPEQDTCNFRDSHWQATLAISQEGDGAIYLLNPKVVAPDGEWEAWFFANWYPGARRFRSFQEMMVDQRESFRRLLKDKRKQPRVPKRGNAAQQAARRGEADTAIAMLGRLVAEGDDASAASLAELCAFRGLWREVIPNAARLIRNPSSVANGEAFLNAIRLLGRAGHETGAWEEIALVAQGAITANLQRTFDEHHEYQRETTRRLLDNLVGYCKRRGGAPHELIRIFDVADPLNGWTDAQRRVHYRKAVDNVSKLRPDLRDQPADLVRHTFALARNLGLDDEIIRIYEQQPFLFYFNDVLDVSRAYMKHGRTDDAWRALRERIHQSVGTHPAEVAPIILLIDDILRPLMTRERCEFVLSAPRGREAAVQ